MEFLKDRSFKKGGFYYLLISLGIITFASPLFRVLGFEYSGLISLAVSVHILYYSAIKAYNSENKNIWQNTKPLWIPVLVLTTIPLLLSLISAFIIPNCSISDGLLFYVEIVYPTAVIAMVAGVFFGVVTDSKLQFHLFLAFFYGSTFIASLLPGYFSGKIYTYGWQYGYFPGFVWDEAMDLSGSYWISRAVEYGMLFLLCFTFWDKEKIKEEYGDTSPKRKHLSWRWLILFLLTFTLERALEFGLNDSDIEKWLDKTITIANIHIHYRSLTTDEIALLKFDAASYKQEIDSIYTIHAGHQVDIYLFPTSDDLFTHIGTREASISKPWLHSIYIAKPNLRSLKHEMAHVLLADYGSYPFDISWSTGLTEGAAVAIEDDFDGIRDCNEYSSEILRMNFAKGVSDVMKPAGFLSSAPSQSYELSGSFTRYLITCCGPERFLTLYHDVDFEKYYGQKIEGLEADWKQWLIKHEQPMGHYDSLRAAFYFKRTSILQQPCVRRIGKLLKYADEAFKEKSYLRADSLYEIIIRESGRLKAIRGRVLSQLFLHNPQAALAILDTTSAAKETNNLSALRILRGDVAILATGDLNRASQEWDEAVKLELGDTYFLASFMRRNFLSESTDIPGVKKILLDLYGIQETSNKHDLIFSLPPKDSSTAAFFTARLFLYISYLERTGNLQEGYNLWKSQYTVPQKTRETDAIFLAPEEILFYTLMKNRFAHYDEIFRTIP